MVDVESLVEVVPSVDGLVWSCVLRWSRLGTGLWDQWLEETGYRPWADSTARQLRAGLAALVAAVRAEENEACASLVDRAAASVPKCGVIIRAESLTCLAFKLRVRGEEAAAAVAVRKEERSG